MTADTCVFYLCHPRGRSFSTATPPLSFLLVHRHDWYPMVRSLLVSLDSRLPSPLGTPESGPSRLPKPLVSILPSVTPHLSLEPLNQYFLKYSL